jgi:hypothetical protein
MKPPEANSNAEMIEYLKEQIEDFRKSPETNSTAEMLEDTKLQLEEFERFCEEGEREMRSHWRNQTFQSLMHGWENSEYECSRSYKTLALRNRFEDLMNMMERNRIWPPPVSSWSHRFRAALREVLSRLPQEVFDRVENEFNFVLEEPELEMLAATVPAPSQAPSRTIVFFRGCLRFTPKALAGLIAHEIARTFVHEKYGRTDEILADNKAREWGFGAELDCKENEKDRLCPNKFEPKGSMNYHKMLMRS